MRRDRSRPLAPGLRVTRVLDRLQATMGLPQTIVDNGPDFAGRTFDEWAYAARVTLPFIRPGKPIENAYVESFKRHVHISGRVSERTLVCERGRCQGRNRSLTDRFQHRAPAQAAGRSQAGAVCVSFYGRSPAAAGSR
jgi:transposase InsO family protein